MSGINSVELVGTLTGKEAVRYTPAGLEVFGVGTALGGVMTMVGEPQNLIIAKAAVEAGRTRTLEFDFPAVSYAETAKALNGLALGAQISLKGFLAPRSMKSRRLIVHITEFN